MRMKIWTIENLQEHMGIRDYKTFADEITRLVAAGELKAVGDIRKANNGKNPVLAKKYRVVTDARNDRQLSLQLIEEIHRTFPLDINKAYYKSHPNEYLADRDRIQQFLDYKRYVLDKISGGQEHEWMSINERSYDIFKDEKFLASENGRAWMNNLGLLDQDMAIYRTPEPFIYYRPLLLDQRPVLIVENKDTWHTVKRLMDEGGMRFGTVIYGEGKKILRSIEDIEEIDFFKDKSNTNVFYYWGDLDPEGMRIYLSLKQRMPAGYHLRLWSQAYKTMIDLADTRQAWRETKKNQGDLTQEHWAELEQDFHRVTLQTLKEKFASNQSLPQEIIHRILLKEHPHVSLFK